MSPLLSVNELKVQFASRDASATAVDDFSLVVNAGECVGLVGESGCGKTTTGLAIMRLLPNNGHIINGNVVLDGVDLATLSEKDMQSQRGRTVALIPQDPMSSLDPVYRIVEENGKLMLKRLKHDPQVLTAVAPDLFQVEIGSIQFQRDAKRNVWGMKISTGRIRDLEFTKEK